jgi:hypothetical protein
LAEGWLGDGEVCEKTDEKKQAATSVAARFLYMVVLYMAAGLRNWRCAAQRAVFYFERFCGLFLKQFWVMAVVFIARGAIEFVVQACCTFRSESFASGLPSGSRLRNLFENTRDRDHHNQILSPRAFQKISDPTAQWSPQGS